MKRYLAMEPSTATGPSEKVVFLKDGFSWLAFLLPAIWLAWHRLWLAAALVLAGVVALSFAGPAGGVLQLLLGILVALEGPAWVVARHRRKGFAEQAILLADNRQDAELFYYGSEPSGAVDSHELARVEPTAAFRPRGWRPVRTLLGTAEAG